MTRERKAAVVGLLLAASLFSGCGDGTSGERQAPVATDQADGGLEASKSIMNMQPPKPTRKK